MTRSLFFDFGGNGWVVLVACFFKRPKIMTPEVAMQRLPAMILMRAEVLKVWGLKKLLE